MDVYVFIYKAVPTKGSTEYGKVGGAFVEIWVFESNKKLAEIKAKSFLIDHSWDIVECENELVVNDEQILRCHEDAQANYYQAKEEGISVFFSAHPQEDRDDGLVEIFPLGTPKFNKTKH